MSFLMPAYTKARTANNQDLNTVLGWLKQEYVLNDSGFWSNRLVIESYFEDGEMMVIDNGTADMPVGFLLGSPCKTDIPIVAVQQEHQGKGLGRKLVEYFIEQAIAEQLPGLVVERTPLASKPFWAALGFEELPSEQHFSSRSMYTHKHAMRLFDTPLNHDPNAEQVHLEVRITHWDETVVKSMEVNTRREFTPSPRLQLERRLVFFSADPDLYIEYIVEDISLGPPQKLKYPESQLDKTMPFWSLDRLLLHD